MGNKHRLGSIWSDKKAKFEYQLPGEENFVEHTYKEFSNKDLENQISSMVHISRFITKTKATIQYWGYLIKSNNPNLPYGRSSVV